MEKIKSKVYYLLYIDLLGTIEKLDKDKDDEYLNIINDLYNETLLILDRVYKDTYRNIEIKSKIFSDNVVLAIEKKDTDDTQKTSFKKGIISNFAAFFQTTALQRGILTRGAITIGELYFDDIFINGKALNRAYLLESQVAIYPRVIYDNEIVMSFIQEYDRRQKTNRDADGIFYIDIFKSLSVLQEELGVIDNIRTAILNYWSQTIYDVEFKEINNIIGKPKTKNTNYKYLQKLYWLITVYEKWCENSNKKEYKLPMPLEDIDILLVWEGNCYYDE